MRDEDASQVAADMHRLANQIIELSNNTETLAEQKVNTATADSLREEQSEVQGELRQLIADLIQLHYESGNIESGDEVYDLALNGSVPIPADADTELPVPDVGDPKHEGADAPSWTSQSN